jgi:prepilin-type N-terminal cleavage/methylation domain-containing protein
MNKAFTLVELAIVIVIIGLLVGGVLQGQELIAQAKIRSQIRQLEAYDAASLTFKSKYDYLPGDFPTSRRDSLGFRSRGGTDNSGNGRIDDNTGYIPNLSSYNESHVFFSDLSVKKMIKEYIWHKASNYSVGVTFPEAKIGGGGVAAVGLIDGMYWFLGPTMQDDASGNVSFYLLSERPTFIPTQAFGIDSKIDDGNPTTGMVRAVIVSNSTTTNFSNETATGQCLGTSASVYNLSSDQPLCRLVIKSKAG